MLPVVFDGRMSEFKYIRTLNVGYHSLNLLSLTKRYSVNFRPFALPLVPHQTLLSQLSTFSSLLSTELSIRLCIALGYHKLVLFLFAAFP